MEIRYSIDTECESVDGSVLYYEWGRYPNEDLTDHIFTDIESDRLRTSCAADFLLGVF